MDKDNEIKGNKGIACCVCTEKSTRKKSFPCGHNICCSPCLENFKPLYKPDNPQCPLCMCTGPWGFSRYMTAATHGSIDSMPRRIAPAPPEDDGRYLTSLRASHPPEHDRSQCRKVSVRIFCKGSCHECEGSNHEKVEKKEGTTDDADHEVKNLSKRLRELKEQEKSLPEKIQRSRDDFQRVMNKVREEIKDAARAYHEMLVEEENVLLQELGEIASASCKHYMALYEEYDELLVKEYELLDRVNEWKKGKSDSENKSYSTSLRAMERSLNELMEKVKGIEIQSRRRECTLIYSKHSPQKGILGKITETVTAYETAGQTSNDVLKTFHAKKKKDVFLHKFCIGVIWIDDTKCVAVLDKASSGNCISFQIMSIDKENIALHPNPASLERRSVGAIHICNIVGSDKKSILISVGREVLRIRLDSCSGEILSVTSTKFQKPVQDICWGQKLTEYFILTYQPWDIFRLNDNGSFSLFRSLTSAWYGPCIYSVGTSVVVGDITKNVFKIYDQSNVKTPVQICPSGSLDQVSPAAVCFYDNMDEWLFLWKGMSENNDNNRRWFLTRHNKSFEFCGLALSGSLEKSDPRGFSVRSNTLVMFYHGGNIAFYQISTICITST